MSQPVKCLDCGVEFSVDYKCCQDISSGPLESEEDIRNKIREIEELTNFNFQKNICINCLDKLISERESINIGLGVEIELLRKGLANLVCEVETDEFKNVSNYKESELINKEQVLKDQLCELKAKEAAYEDEMTKLIKDLKQLNDEENKYWNEFNGLERNIYIYEREKAYSKNKITCLENEIKKFSNTNIINELFNISISEKYGTINGLRMGISNEHSIPFDELNSGWGYIIHLTAVIARKVNYTFKKYDLIPMGNYSKLINKNSKIIHDLTISPNLKYLEKFNESMSAYLTEFIELFNFINSNSLFSKITNYDFYSYNLGNNSIKGFSIKIDINNPENWAKCMKYLLTILKSYILLALKSEEEEYREILEKAQLVNSASI